MTNKVQIIRDGKNKPAYAVVPWADYVALAGEDAVDAMLVDAAEAARGEQRFPSEIVERLVKGDNAVKVLREWRGLTQTDLASKSGLAALYVSQLETGHRKLGGAAAKKLAPALGVTIDVLMGE